MTLRFRIAVALLSLATILALTHVCLGYAARLDEKDCYRHAREVCGEQQAIVEYSGNGISSSCKPSCVPDMDPLTLGSR